MTALSVESRRHIASSASKHNAKNFVRQTNTVNSVTTLFESNHNYNLTRAFAVLVAQFDLFIASTYWKISF